MRKPTTKQIAKMPLYLAIHPNLGPHFAFHAIDDQDAQMKINGWNRYHSFTSATSKDTCRKAEAGDFPGCRCDIHDEYIF